MCVRITGTRYVHSAVVNVRNAVGTDVDGKTFGKKDLTAEDEQKDGDRHGNR